MDRWLVGWLAVGKIQGVQVKLVFVFQFTSTNPLRVGEQLISLLFVSNYTCLPATRWRKPTQTLTNNLRKFLILVNSARIVSRAERAIFLVRHPNFLSATPNLDLSDTLVYHSHLLVIFTSSFLFQEMQVTCGKFGWFPVRTDTLKVNYAHRERERERERAKKWWRNYPFTNFWKYQFYGEKKKSPI